MTLPAELDQALLARLMVRDERAFNELVLRYERRILALVTRLLGHPDEAREVTQEVFIQVFKSIDSFRGDAKLSSWIYRIAVNHCKNRMRYLSVRRDRDQDSFDQDQASHSPHVPSAHSVRPDEALAGRQLQEIVQRAMLQIEPNFREILILRDVEELSYEEIVEITQLQLGTVKSRLFRARTQLRALVERALGGAPND